MAPADPPTVQAAVAASAIHTRYAQAVDPESAYERLSVRLQQAQADAEAPPRDPPPSRTPRPATGPAQPRPPPVASTPRT
jgi:hypothetical protein